jgi:2-polyprenyl-3-methyl-5-hydroxy-6-metoxy-1,4-benzoquinol methylase
MLRPWFHLSRGEVLRCPACRLEVAHDDTVTESHDSQFHQGLDESEYVSYFEPFRKGQYRTVLAKLQTEPGLRLLDVGASYGWMLVVGAELGFDAFGLEPSPMHYGPELADRIAHSTLDEYAANASVHYDVVTIWHVLEHLRDPFAGLRDVHDLLKPNGRAVIAVPNAAGRMYLLGSLLARRIARGRLVEELWYTHNPNMHRHYFTRESLMPMLDSAGLKAVDTYTLEAFDWHTIWTRGATTASRALLRGLGPGIAASRFTAAENLIVVAERVT